MEKKCVSEYKQHERTEWFRKMLELATVNESQIIAKVGKCL